MTGYARYAAAVHAAISCGIPEKSMTGGELNQIYYNKRNSRKVGTGNPDCNTVLCGGANRRS